MIGDVKLNYKVLDFPIFHNYLAKLLLHVGLADADFSHVFYTVGEYTVSGRCECGEDTCNTMYMQSESLVGKDGAYCCGFKNCYIILNFYKDGFFQVESLADSVEDNFPFYQEIRDVLAGRTVFYDDAYAKIVIDDFMGKLKRCDVVKVDV